MCVCVSEREQEARFQRMGSARLRGREKGAAAAASGREGSSSEGVKESVSRVRTHVRIQVRTYEGIHVRTHAQRLRRSDSQTPIDAND